jgi:hypothetical protein
MNRSVIPSLPENHHSLNEWKFLNGILSSSPIDFGQLDFYLHMVNKSTGPQSVPNVNKSYSTYSNSYSPGKLAKPTSENNNKKSGFGIASNRYVSSKIVKIWLRTCKTFKP